MVEMFGFNCSMEGIVEYHWLIGNLQYARLWHDNTGKGKHASWFLNYMIVRDLQTRQRWHFIANRWFAVDEDDGQVSLIKFQFMYLNPHSVFRLLLLIIEFCPWLTGRLCRNELSFDVPPVSTIDFTGLADSSPQNWSVHNKGIIREVVELHTLLQIRNFSDTTY